LALAAIIAMARCDLNAADFISRGVEGSGESHNKSIGCCHHSMETPRLRDIAGQTSPTGLLGNNTC
jgi:hypothetical protein